MGQSKQMCLLLCLLSYTAWESRDTGADKRGCKLVDRYSVVEAPVQSDAIPSACNEILCG